MAEKTEKTTPGLIFSQVLLVEDDASHRFLIERALKTVTKSILWSDSLEGAHKLVCDNQIDLVVCDLNLSAKSEKHPVTFFKEIKNELPVVVLTSSTLVQDGVAAMKQGASDFIVKNFDESFNDALFIALTRIYVSSTLEKENKKHREEADLLRVAIDKARDGFALITQKGEIGYSNSAFHTFIGMSQGDEKNILSIAPSSVVRGPELIQKIKEALSNLRVGGFWSSELALVDQPDCAYEMSISRLDQDHDACEDHEKRFVLLVRDVTDRKRREKFQREILSTTTHDLKGPLGAISLSCDILLDHNVSVDKTTELIQRIASSASNAMQLIDEFLSARKIEEGALILHPVLQDVAPLVEQVMDTFQVTARAKEIRLSAKLERDNLKGRLDTLGFQRVLANLVSNAVKFTPKGGEVRVALRESNLGLMLSVSDTGSGMDAKEARQLFQRYARLDRHKGTAGTGLGLFIVKSIVQAHGGDIQVTSAPGQGSTFEVVFPSDHPVDERGQVICI